MASELETFVVLDLINKNPGLRRRELGVAAFEAFGRGWESFRPLLSSIDNLEFTKLLYRHDFKYYLTVSGEAVFLKLKEDLRAPLMRVLM